MIDSYEFGEIIVDGKRYTSHVLVSGKMVKPWWTKEGHLLGVEDVEDIVRAQPDIVIIGTGKSGEVRIPTSVRDYFKQHNIRLVSQRTDAACQTYNRLASSARVVAALHLTC